VVPPRPRRRGFRRRPPSRSMRLPPAGWGLRVGSGGLGFKVGGWELRVGGWGDEFYSSFVQAKQSDRFVCGSAPRDPRGGLRPFHQKSTCPRTIDVRAWCGANLDTVFPKWGGGGRNPRSPQGGCAKGSPLSKTVDTLHPVESGYRGTSLIRKRPHP